MEELKKKREILQQEKDGQERRAAEATSIPAAPDIADFYQDDGLAAALTPAAAGGTFEINKIREMLGGADVSHATAACHCRKLTAHAYRRRTSRGLSRGLPNRRPQFSRALPSSAHPRSRSHNRSRGQTKMHQEQGWRQLGQRPYIMQAANFCPEPSLDCPRHCSHHSEASGRQKVGPARLPLQYCPPRRPKPHLALCCGTTSRNQDLPRAFASPNMKN